MSTSSITDHQLAELRRRASSRLTGDSSANAKPFAAADALAVLHDLASSPDTAADALALLHELQVHQVELELQAEELRESRIELESMLRRQIVLYDTQPVGCFTIDRELAVHELNLRGAALLGMAREDAYGMHLDGCMSADGGRRLRELLGSLAPGGDVASTTLQWMAKDVPSCALRVDARMDPDAQRFLLVLTPVD